MSEAVTELMTFSYLFLYSKPRPDTSNQPIAEAFSRLVS